MQRYRHVYRHRSPRLGRRNVRINLKPASKSMVTGGMMKIDSQLPRMLDRAFQFSRIGAMAVAIISTAGPRPAAAQTNDAGLSQLPSGPARITKAIDEKQLVLIRGNVHPLALAKSDQGAVSDAQPLDRMLLLLQRAPEQEAVLRQLLDDQLTLNSPKHHAWLTPQQFGAQFGPTDADLQATTSWLAAK